jgi:hypothetical protein
MLDTVDAQKLADLLRRRLANPSGQSQNATGSLYPATLSDVVPRLALSQRFFKPELSLTCVHRSFETRTPESYRLLARAPPVYSHQNPRARELDAHTERNPADKP